MRTVLVSVLLIGLSGHATGDGVNKSSAQPWTPDSWSAAVQAMPRGAATRGEKLATEGYCITCHGDKGVSPSRNSPSLAGQDPVFIYKALLDFKSGLWHIDNKSTGMYAVTQPLTKQDMADLAAFYAAQNRSKQGSTSTASPSSGPAACLPCHPTNGSADPGHTGPILDGQSTYYLKRQLTAFKTRKRNTDVSGVMESMTQTLSNKQREELIQFFSGQ